MKERAILFSAPMVRALLAGTKTQTRRVVKPQPKVSSELEKDLPAAWEAGFIGVCCPYGVPGDMLLVAKEIPSSPNDDYCAGSDGQIYSRTKYAGFGRKERVEWYPLSEARGKGSYMRVSLCHENKKVTRSVHSLVCEAFYGPAPFKGAQVRHLDGDPLNNEPANLAWGTQAENWQDRKAHGNGVEGEKHHHAKLRDDERAHVRWAIERGLTSRRGAAQALGMSQSAIYEMVHGAELVGARPVVPETIPRITLEVTDVRVERLGEMSYHDALAEGIYQDSAGFHWRQPAPVLGHADPRHAFAELWEAINGKGSVDANPFCWVIEFRRVDQARAEVAR